MTAETGVAGDKVPRGSHEGHVIHEGLDGYSGLVCIPHLLKDGLKGEGEKGSSQRVPLTCTLAGVKFAHHCPV